MTEQKRKEYIAALLREREMRERDGKLENVKLIDEQLAVLGHRAEKPVERAERRPAVRGRASQR